MMIDDAIARMLAPTPDGLITARALCDPQREAKPPAAHPTGVRWQGTNVQAQEAKGTWTARPFAAPQRPQKGTARAGPPGVGLL